MKNAKAKNLLLDMVIMIVPLMIFIFWIVYGWKVTYQVHDDRYMMEFLSGKFLGRFDAHLVYIKYPLAILLLLPYKLVRNHDWYAVEMLVLSFISIAIMTWYIIRRLKNIFQKIISQGLFYSIFIVCWVNEVACFTYTTIAALVGMCIIVVYVLGQQRKKDLAVILFCCFIAYNLRTDLFLMVLPVCGILWLWKFLQDNKKFQIQILVGLLFVIGGSYLWNQQAYSVDGWKEYTQYNKSRTMLYDFYFEDIMIDGKYEENRDFFEKNGINEQQWKIIQSYDLYLCNDELYQKMSGIVDSYKDTKSIGNKVKTTGTIVMKEGLLKSKFMTLISFFAWMLVVCGMLIKKEKKMNVVIIGFMCVHVILWCYLGYKGRILPRVSHSMLLMQIVTPMISLYLLDVRKIFTDKLKNKQLLLRIGCIAGVIVLGGLSLKISMKTNNNMRKESTYLDQYIIEEYCAKHPDQFFFLDVFSVVECKYFFDFHNANAYENFISFGDWYGNSPLSREKLADRNMSDVNYNVKNNDSVRIIGKTERDITYITDILGEGYKLVEEETLDAVQHDYFVYRVEKV